MRVGTLELEGPGGLSIAIDFTARLVSYRRAGAPAAEVTFEVQALVTDLMRQQLDLVPVACRGLTVAELRSVGPW